MRFIVVFTVILFGCEQNNKVGESCSFQGFHSIKSKSVSCTEDLVVSSVEFSNGISRKLIQGNLKFDKKKLPFTLVLDSSEVTEFTFPLKEIDSSTYQCSVKYKSSKMIEIEWTNGPKRVFLRKKLPQ